MLGHGIKRLPPDKAGRLKDIVIWWHTITFIFTAVLFPVLWHCILDTDINNPLNLFGCKWLGNISSSYAGSSSIFPKWNKNGLLIGRSHIPLLWGACRSHPSVLCRTAHTAGCYQYSSSAKGIPQGRGAFHFHLLPSLPGVFWQVDICGICTASSVASAYLIKILDNILQYMTSFISK